MQGQRIMAIWGDGVKDSDFTGDTEVLDCSTPDSSTRDLNLHGTGETVMRTWSTRKDRYPHIMTSLDVHDPFRAYQGRVPLDTDPDLRGGRFAVRHSLGGAIEAALRARGPEFLPEGARTLLYQFPAVNAIYDPKTVRLSRVGFGTYSSEAIREGEFAPQISLASRGVDGVLGDRRVGQVVIGPEEVSEYTVAMVLRMLDPDATTAGGGEKLGVAIREGFGGKSRDVGLGVRLDTVLPTDFMTVLGGIVSDLRRRIAQLPHYAEWREREGITV